MPEGPARSARIGNPPRFPAWTIDALLAGATLLAYWGVWNHEFLTLDDNLHITQNPHVASGLSWENFVWALTTGHAGNWQPLTWLSHMVDCELFGLDPAGPHLVNLLLHIACTLLLFRVFARATGAVGRSAFVAAVFALHPLHVESVAWATERKDVLSGLFWFLATGAYFRSVAAPSGRGRAAVLVFYALGLTAKPMLVTLPFVLLLLDYWPLRRLESPWDGRGWIRLAREKLPLFALALASCAITWLVQRGKGGMSIADEISLPLRIENAIVSYAVYLVDAVWPTKLGVFYPHPMASYPTWQLAGSALFLLAATAGALLAARRRPYAPVGWFWYLGTLVPVIGIVQVGAQARADRYTYLPLIGVSIVVAWGASEIAAAWRLPRRVLVVMGVLAAGCWTYLARAQVAIWENDQSLVEREAELVPGHYEVRGMLGNIRLRQGRIDEAIEELRAAVQLRPSYADGHSNYGMALELQGRKDEALAEYELAVRWNPILVAAHHNLARLLAEQGRKKEAIEHYETALASDPAFAESHLNLGLLLIEAGRQGEGVRHLERALELKPDLGAARRALDAARPSPGGRPRGP